MVLHYGYDRGLLGIYQKFKQKIICMLLAQNVNKKFNGIEVLHSVDVEVEPKKITVLIGPNGSGKSTLLRALSLLDPPSEGIIEIDKIRYSFPAEKRDQRAIFIWPKVTMVFQQLFLWPHLTLKENITLPARKGKVDNFDTKLHELIDAFNMAHFIDRYPNETSLGQRQRAALARAIILNPSYLLLDEITSALDVEQTTSVLSYLQGLKENGMGILLVTHLMGFARRAADKIVFLDKGKVLETSGPELIDFPTQERVRKFLAMYKSNTGTKVS